MSEDYPNIGTVRRRPRAPHQQTNHRDERASSNAGVNGSRIREDRDEEGEHQGSGTDYEQDFADAPRSKRRHQRPWENAGPRKALPYRGPEPDQEGFRFPFDPWRLLGAVKRNIALILAGAAVIAFAGFALAAFLVQYNVTVPLLRKTSNAFRSESTDQIAIREYTDQTLYSFMKSGDVLRRVVAQSASIPSLAALQLTPKLLADSVQVKPHPNPDFALLQVKAFGALPAMVDLANLYASNVVGYTVELQRRETDEINRYLQQKLGEADVRIQALSDELRKFSKSGFMDSEKEADAEMRQLVELQFKRDAKQLELDTIDTKIRVRESQLSQVAPVNTEVQKAEGELRTLLLSMTEAHPIVQNKKREIEALKRHQSTAPPATNSVAQVAGTNPLAMQVLDLQSEKPALRKQIDDLNAAITNLQERLVGRVDDDVQYTLKKTELQSQKTAREMLAAKQRQAELITENSLGYFALPNAASLGNVNYKSRWLKVGLLALAAGLAGLVASLGLVMLSEVLDTTLKTPSDVARATGLPILATLGDLRKMSAAAQVNWAFKTLTHLRGKLSRDAEQAMVCGIISSKHGEGRSTWVNLLVSAASQRGLRVLTVDTRPNAAAPQTGSKDEVPRADTEPAAQGASQNHKPQGQHSDGINLPAQVDTLLTPNALLAPDKVADQLNDPGAQPVVHIPLPGWVWSLERRKQWGKALEYWRQIDNLVIFVELPPACEPEAVLLAEHLPQVIWLSGSGMADVGETTGHIDTLRHARCNLVGAVVNQAPPPVLNTRIARWFTKMTALFFVIGSLGNVTELPAQELQQLSGAQPAELTFTAAKKKQRAAWQQRLTFGPGDVLDIQLYGNPAWSTLTRTNILVGPDGRISYLEAQGVTAAGLTVEELSQQLNSKLVEFYPGARTIVSPVSFTSKKYFVLGKVNAKGAYPLDRPMTVIEAVARAKGLETGLYNRTSVEMADLGRSFIVRNGQKLDIDLAKLFAQGDLSQNIQIEPNDYLYFASAGARDIYVLGEVMNPGPIGFLPEATVLTAITDRGGYGDKAYKRKVLVIRGSLSEPETFVVDTEGILQARTADFRLEPRDIVYVSRRPWAKAEELLDEAAASFIQGSVTFWAGQNVGPIIEKRLFPSTRGKRE